MIALGRSTYSGFAATIKLVGTGERGRRDLSFDEARQAMAALLAGEISDAQAGAFMIAMRLKGEAPEELAGFARALRDAATPLEADCGARPLVACGGAYDGVASAPHLSVAAAATAAACGAGIIMHCGTTLGPKRGVTQGDVLEALGGPAAPSAVQSAKMLERSGATLVHAPAVLPGWQRIAAIRDELGVRGPLHAAERLHDFFGAGRFVIGFTHTPYSDRALGALERLGAARAVTVRGIEGSDVIRPARPSAFGQEGALDLPEQLGHRMPSEGGAGPSARATRAVLAGELNGAVEHAVALSAGLRLYAAGLAGDPRAGARRSRSALRDGSATATLDALVG